MANINRVVLEGNLTRDPEIRSTASGTSLCKLRMAVNERSKESGDWADRANFFDVTCWGKLAETVADYLAKGSGLIVDGRLRWREWEAEGGGKRQAVEVVAENVRFTGGKKEKVGGGEPTSDVPADTEDLPEAEPAEPVKAASESDREIPF
jgi:single-strand DNA-binding protein